MNYDVYPLLNAECEISIETFSAQRAYRLAEL